MIRNRPTWAYCGLTIVLSHPSRFDKVELLSATGGYFFFERGLKPDFNKYQCDIRVKEDRSALLPDTKCVLLLGEEAASSWLNNTENTLNQIRGSVYNVNGIPHVASYFPQDCVDIKDFEGEYWEKQSDDFSHEYARDNDDEDEGDEKGHQGVTKRRNFGWWLIRDINRCKYILEHGVPEKLNPNYIVYPRQEDIVDILTNTKGKYLDFDMETDYDPDNIQCFSFSFDNHNVFCVPTLLPDYSWAYSGLHFIYRSLAVAARDNILVAHNGANFDYFVLSHKYRIPINKVFDTLIAHHRCFPEMEKSLGHGTSHLTWEPYHKDEDAPYSNLDNAKKKWLYCGKDVFTMGLIRKEILRYAKTIPGLLDSINQAMESIKPYLTTTLQGIAYRQDILEATMRENDRLMFQYLRIINLLIGENTVKLIRGKSKSGMPGSNVQCVRYFHDLLNYPIIAKGKEKADGTRSPSLGKKSIYNLRLNHNNPVLDYTLAYRELSRESGSLKFTPWQI